MCEFKSRPWWSWERRRQRRQCSSWRRWSYWSWWPPWWMMLTRWIIIGIYWFWFITMMATRWPSGWRGEGGESPSLISNEEAEGEAGRQGVKHWGEVFDTCLPFLATDLDEYFLQELLEVERELEEVKREFAAQSKVVDNVLNVYFDPTNIRWSRMFKCSLQSYKL